MNEFMRGCPWAANRVKLEQSINALLTRKVELSEETIRAEYESRAGRIVEKVAVVGNHAPANEEDTAGEKPRARRGK